MTDPIVRARLGKDAEDYVAKLIKMSRQWMAEQIGQYDDKPNWQSVSEYARSCNRKDGVFQHTLAGLRPHYLLNIGGGSESYHRVLDRDRSPICRAHLLDVGRLSQTYHSDDGALSLSHNLGVSDWSGVFQFVGVRSTHDAHCPRA